MNRDVDSSSCLCVISLRENYSSWSEKLSNQCIQFFLISLRTLALFILTLSLISAGLDLQH